MSKLLLHPKTEDSLNKMVSSSSHAVLIVGADGSGKRTTAREIIRQKLGLTTIDNLNNYPYFLDIEEDNTISIDSIRQLQRFLQLKTTGTKTIRRGVIISNAQMMPNEAQNALLKSLEEPPEDTIIVLTANSTVNLRPTIYSRVQQMQVLPVDLKEAEEHFVSAGINQADIQRAHAISGGHIGLLSALLNDKEHALLDQIRVAKEILAGTAFERLILVDSLAKDKKSIPLFFHGFRLVCSAALSQAAVKNNNALIKKWVKCLDAVYRVESALISNPNSKLLLTDFMLNL